MVLAANPYRSINNFNAGELSPLLSAREDLQKYQNGASIMENMIPLPQGGAQKRPGTKFIAEVKTSSLATRLLPFEFSTSQSYIIEAGNQYMRFYTNGAQITAGGGTEDISALDNIIAHWLMNDNAANTAVLDDDGNTHDGVASTNTEDITTEGKVGTGSFDLDGQFAISVTDSADFSFIEGVDGDFSLTSWIYISDTGTDQVIISKWDETAGAGAREWRLLLDSSRKLRIDLADESLLIDSDIVSRWKLDDSLQTDVVLDSNGSSPGALTDGSNNFTSYANAEFSPPIKSPP